MVISYYLAKKLFDHIFCGTDIAVYAKPTNIKVKLYSVAPSASGGGTEMVGTGYSSGGIATTVGTTPWPAVAANASEIYYNGAALTWSVGATVAWSPIVAVGITDESGNLLFFDELDTAISPANGDTVAFPAGTNGLKLTLS